MDKSAEIANGTRHGGWEKWLAAGVCMVAVAVFFRQQIWNQFSFLSGDRHDGVIVVALLEHWFNVFKGLSHWASPNYFFPYDKTLSYNDGYFLYGCIYSVFRALSIDPMLAAELVNVTLKVIGFASFLLAMRRMLGLRYEWALLGAVLFTISNNTYLQIVHAQMLAVAFVPLIALFLHEAYQALLHARRRRLLCHGALAALLFAALLMTSAYTAWFFALFLSIMFGLQIACLRGAAAARLRGALTRHRGTVLLIGLIGVLGLLPFAQAYVFGHHGRRAWEEVLVHSPSILDSINVGANNLLFGDVFNFLSSHCAACDIGNGERESGIGPILLLLAMVAIVSVIARRLRGGADQHGLLLGMALACAVTWLLTVRVGPYTGWFLVHKFWPGGSGLRVVARIFIVLSVPMIALAVWYLSTRAARWGRVAAGAVCALLIAEEINLSPTVGQDRYQQLDRAVAIPAPPPGCRAFFTTESPDSDNSEGAAFVPASLTHNVDAMVIAEVLNLPTINGHASFTPRDWNFDAPTRADYQARVTRYAQAHDISGLCRLDLNSKQWATDLSTPRATMTLAYWDFARAAGVDGVAVDGFDLPEPFGRWSKGNRASIRYHLPAALPQARMARITFAAALVKGRHLQTVRVTVNHGATHQFVFVGSARRVIDIALPTGMPQDGVIAFELPDAISPRQLSLNDDARQLAVGLKAVELR